jgi:Protein of unknown function (DUF2608)
MKTYIINITLISFMLISQAFAEIIEIPDLVLLESILKKENQDTLVIFDVDHVLIMPTDEYTLNRNPYRKQLWKELQTSLSKEKIKFLQSIITSNARWRLVDPKIISILANLKERYIPTIALTSLSTGKLGVIEKREELRSKELKSVGISFLDLSPLKDDILAHELEGMDGIPMLKQGIILTAEIDKAIVLEYILHRKNYYPKTIIFVDDQLRNLKSVEKLCTKLQIEFQGFHYTAVSLMSSPPIDKQMEDLRFRILEREYRWLNYNELLNRTTSKSEIQEF